MLCAHHLIIRTPFSSLLSHMTNICYNRAVTLFCIFSTLLATASGTRLIRWPQAFPLPNPCAFPKSISSPFISSHPSSPFTVLTHIITGLNISLIYSLPDIVPNLPRNLRAVQLWSICRIQGLHFSYDPGLKLGQTSSHL